MKILIVEDEIDLSNSIAASLQHEKHRCEAVLNYADAIEKATLYNYDILIINNTINGSNGLELIQELKNKGSNAGIMIISSKDAMEVKISALDAGADDYLVKPFQLPELKARVKSIIRRRDFDGKREMSLDELKLKFDSRMVMVNDQPLDLTKREYDLLIYLIANRNRLLSKQSIAEHLRGEREDLVESCDFIYSHIKNLRKKIREKEGRNYIMTIYGIGYKFIVT